MTKNIDNINHMDEKYYAPDGKTVEISSTIARTGHKVKVMVSYGIELDDMDKDFQYDTLNFLCIHLRKPVIETRKELHNHLIATKGHDIALEMLIK